MKSTYLSSNVNKIKLNKPILKQFLFFISFLILLFFVTGEVHSHIYAEYNKLNSYTNIQKEELIDWVNRYCNTSHNSWNELLLDTKLQCRVDTLDEIHKDFYHLPGIENDITITYVKFKSVPKVIVVCIVMIALWFFIYLMERKTIHAFMKEKSSKYFLVSYLCVIFFSIYDSTLNTVLQNTFFLSVVVFIFVFIKFINQILLKNKNFRWLGRLTYIVSAVFLISLASYIATRALSGMMLPKLARHLVQNNDIRSIPAQLGIYLFNGDNKYSNTLVHLAVQKGSLDDIKYLVEEKRENPNIASKTGIYNGTPLEYALHYKAYVIADYLLLHTPEYDARYHGHTRLATASKTHNLAFLKKVVGTRIIDLNEVLYAVREAIRYNDNDALNFLLEHFELTFEDCKTYKIMEYAYDEYNPEAYAMLEHFFNINNINYCQDNRCEELMNLCVKRKDYTMCDYLVSKGAESANKYNIAGNN